ncbi:esterase [Hahella sp. CCB-MM4]|uniref:alpha/beta hydrolase n=1 Tax=Hahella sp. (strain CCB-MM4) TaxID=1926491 RepID=UPI000B9B5387|nr:alpha/beta hydrolase [Hahella sp. CCB-MM4]OZG72947.1 esterase [Hahella sp. CCB-MM4]
MKLYRQFARQADIDTEYNAVLSVPDLAPYIKHDTQANQQTREELEYFPDVKYGPMRDETLDIFPSANKDSPVFVFIHGGYWRSMSSRDFSLVARGLVARGVTVVLPNYSLCPQVSIPEITRQVRASVAWVYQNIQQYNGDRNRIFVGGHSAGAQQVGMLVSTGWEREYELPQNIIKGGIPISGIYDLTPLYYSWLQPTVSLNQYVISTQSPLLQIPEHGMPLFITVGAKESTEFVRQSRDYHASWIEKGFPAELFIQPDKNHFTSFRDLNDPDSQLSEAVLRFMDVCENRFCSDS